MRVLITGGAGFIGSNLALALQDEHDVLIIDKMQDEQHFANGNLKCLGHFKNLLAFKGELMAMDILSHEASELIYSFKPQLIFHQAAISDTTAMNQYEVIRTNLNVFKALIIFCIKNSCKLIYASSASVYGNLAAPQSVGLQNPLNPYAFSKLMMDRLNDKYKNELDIVGLRYFNVYGKGEFFKGKTASMILQFALQILANKPLVLFENSDKIFRDFVYIKDVIAANLAAMDAKSGVYNVGYGKEESFANMLKYLQEELRVDIPPKYIKNPYLKAYQFHTKAALSKDLAYTPKYDLKSGIKDYLPDIKRIYEEEF